jgi:hypothetical protein
MRTIGLIGRMSWEWSIRADMASILLQTLGGCRPGDTQKHIVRPQVETPVVRSCLLLNADKVAPEE